MAVPFPKQARSTTLGAAGRPMEHSVAMDYGLLGGAPAAGKAPVRPMDNPVPCGFRQAGNTCYLASALQCILQIPAFCALARSLGDLAREGSVWRLLAEGSASVATKSVATLQNWKGIAEELGFRWGQQQDASEFMVRLMALLVQELVDDDGAFAKLLGIRVKAQLTQRFACTCMPREIAVEDHVEARDCVMWPVEIFPHADAVSLQELLDATMRPEEKQGHGRVCTCCGAPVHITEQMTIAEAPAILVIPLHRSRHGCKVMRHVELNAALKFGGRRFVLRTVVEHIGASAAVGHYVCWAIRGASCLRFDDDVRTSWEGLPDDVHRNAAIAAYVVEDADIDGAVVPTTGSSAPEQPAESVLEAGCGNADGSTQPSCGPSALQRDARALLAAWSKGEDPRQVLLALPRTMPERGGMVSVSNVEGLLQQRLTDLIHDNTNGDAAMEVMQYPGDVYDYRMSVLLTATAIAEGLPQGILLDVVYGLTMSLLHKDFSLDLRRWRQSRNRWWYVGTAASAQGKSPCLTPFVDLLAEVLRSNAAWAAGYPYDNFHVEGGGRCSTAAAVDKLRTTNGYLLLQADEAGALLDSGFVGAGKSDRAAVVDLCYFLNTAHGGAFSDSTLASRLKQAKPRTAPPAAAASASHHHQQALSSTNVTVVWLQQEQFLATWWSPVADQKPIGLVQRFLFGFASAHSIGSVAAAGFLDMVTKPLLSEMWSSMLRVVGPKATQLDVQRVCLTERQGLAVCQIEELLRALSQQKTLVAQTLAKALPKGMYWLGTAALANHLVGHFLHGAIAARAPSHIPLEVDDATFVSAALFVERRFLYGQAVLNRCVIEKYWQGFFAPRRMVPGDPLPLLLRVLRLSPGNCIREQDVVEADLLLKRALRDGAPDVRGSARQTIQQLLQQIADLKLGDISSGAARAVHKYCRESLSPATVDWLRDHRIPLHLWRAASLKVDCEEVAAGGGSEDVLAAAPTSSPRHADMKASSGTPSAKRVTSVDEALAPAVSGTGGAAELRSDVVSAMGCAKMGELTSPGGTHRQPSLAELWFPRGVASHSALAAHEAIAAEQSPAASLELEASSAVSGSNFRAALDRVPVTSRDAREAVRYWCRRCPVPAAVRVLNCRSRRDGWSFSVKCTECLGRCSWRAQGVMSGARNSKAELILLMQGAHVARPAPQGTKVLNAAAAAVVEDLTSERRLLTTRGVRQELCRRGLDAGCTDDQLRSYVKRQRFAARVVPTSINVTVADMQSSVDAWLEQQAPLASANLSDLVILKTAHGHLWCRCSHRGVTNEAPFAICPPPSILWHRTSKISARLQAPTIAWGSASRRHLIRCAPSARPSDYSSCSRSLVFSPAHSCLPHSIQERRS